MGYSGGVCPLSYNVLHDFMFLGNVAIHLGELPLYRLLFLNSLWGGVRVKGIRRLPYIAARLATRPPRGSGQLRIAAGSDP